jgi:hypothetical protein
LSHPGRTGLPSSSPPVRARRLAAELGILMALR